MLIQIDIPKELNQKLKIHKAQEDMKSIEALILAILEDYFYKK